MNLVVESAIPDAVNIAEVIEASLLDPDFKVLKPILESSQYAKGLPTSLKTFANVVSELSVDTRGIILRNQQI